MIVFYSFCFLFILTVLNADKNLNYDREQFERGEFTTQNSQTAIDNDNNGNTGNQNSNPVSEEIVEDLSHLDAVIETIPSSHSKPAINPFFILSNKKKIPLYFLYKFNQHVLRPLQEKWQEFNTFLAYPFYQNGGLCLLNPPHLFGNLREKKSFLLNGALSSIQGLHQHPLLCPFQYGNTRKD